MNIVVSNGCPGSRWEALFPMLNGQSGHDAFGLWLDELFSTLGAVKQSGETIEPPSHMAEKALSLFSNTGSESLFLLDSRTLGLFDFLSKHFPQAKFLLFYVTAENGLARAFQQGKDPEAFMATWYAVNQYLVRFQRRHRHCSLLLNADAAIRHPEALEKVCRRIDVEMPSPNSRVSCPEKESLALELFLAKQYLQGQSFVQEIELELEASAQPLGDTAHDELQALDVYQDYQERQLRLDELIQIEKSQKLLIVEYQNEINALVEINKKSEKNYQTEINEAAQTRASLVAASATIEQENELLLLQLHQVQEELEAVFTEKQKIKQTEKNLNKQLEQSILLVDHQSQLAKIQQEKENLIAVHKKNEQESEILLSQLQEKLKAAITEKQKIEQTEKALNRQLKQVKQERDKQSTLITDKQGQLIKLQQEKERLIAIQREMEQENELLLLQLHQVQEELENYFLKYQELIQKESKEEDSLDVTVPSPASTPTIKRTKKIKKREQRHAAILRSSEFFDEAWYLAQYPDVAEASIGAAEHYLRYGAVERRDPSPDFSTAFYLDNNPDIDVMTVNPLIHYIQFGRDEGRAISNKADVVW